MQTQQPLHFRAHRVCVLTVALLMSACSSLGPGNVVPDQFDYNQAIGRASNEQMLLNLVRLRYSDVPVFLGVNSVLTQYIYAGNANLSGAVGTSVGDAANSVGGTAGVRYIERPTITYSPLSGEEFAEQVMTPIPAELVFSLLQSGWPATDLLTMGLERLGEQRNPLSQALATEAGRRQHREFRETADLILEVASRDGMEMLREPQAPESRGSFLVFRESAEPEMKRLVEELKDALGLAPDVWRFQVTRNVIECDEDQVTFRVRSLLDLMGYLSRGVRIPPVHLEQQLGRETEEGLAASALVPLRVHSGPERPAAAFVSVNYEEQWFWIETGDVQSKKSFGLLTYLFLMMATTPEGSGPLITVPAG